MELAGPAAEFDLAENIPRKARRIVFRTLPLHRISVRAVRRLAQVFDFDAPPGLAPHTVQPHPARDGLTEIDPIASPAEFFDLHRLQHLHHAVGRPVLRPQPTVRSPARDGILPGRVVETGCAPARLLAAGVVLFARINLIHPHRAFGHLPGRVGNHPLLRTVVVNNLQLRDQPRRAVGHRPPTPHVVKTVSEHRADHVFAAAEPLRHIVSQVRHRVLPEIIFDRNAAIRQPRTFVVVGLVRGEHVAAHLLPVQVKFEITEPGDVHTGRNHLAAGYHPETLAQQRGRKGRFGSIGGKRPVALPRRTDPLRLPVGFTEQPHVPMGGGTPCRGASAGIPNAHAPPAGIPAAERFPAVTHPHRIIPHAAAVPTVGTAPTQQLLRRGDLHLPAALALAIDRAVGTNDPRQPRRGDIDRLGIFKVLAPHPVGTHSNFPARRTGFVFFTPSGYEFRTDTGPRAAHNSGARTHRNTQTTKRPPRTTATGISGRWFSSNRFSLQYEVRTGTGCGLLQHTGPPVSFAGIPIQIFRERDCATRRITCRNPGNSRRTAPKGTARPRASYSGIRPSERLSCRRQR